MQAKANKAKTDSKSELLKPIEKLRVQQESARDKLKQLQAAGDGAWDDLKTAVEQSWEELTSAFSKATASFK